MSWRDARSAAIKGDDQPLANFEWVANGLRLVGDHRASQADARSAGRIKGADRQPNVI